MRQQTGQKLSKHRLSLSFYGQYIYQGYFCESWNSGPSELTSFRRQKSKKREKERMRKSARHICRTVKRQRRLGVCLFRYLRAAVCLNCLPNLPFYPCCTTASLATNVIRRVGSCVGRSSDFRCGFVCPQSFAALHQSTAATVARFGCCESLGSQLRRRDSTQQALHTPHLHFQIQPWQLRDFKMCIAFRFLPEQRGLSPRVRPRFRQIVLHYSFYV